MAGRPPDWPAIGDPMTPRPTKAIRMLNSPCPAQRPGNRLLTLTPTLEGWNRPGGRVG